MNIPHYKKLALQKHKEHRKFLEGLKKKPPKSLDYVSLQTHEEVFAEVDCLSCANCCKTTGPLFTAKDIERLAKLFRVKPSEFEQKYLKTDEDGDIILQQVPCVFLNADNTCSVYEHRPKACREYPHTDRRKIYTINNITLNNTVICPAAYLFVEKLQAKLKLKKEIGSY